MISLHIDTLYWQYLRTTLPAWLATETLTVCTFTCRNTFHLENVFNQLRNKVNLNKSQAVFFSKKHSLPTPLDLNDSSVEFGREVTYLGIIVDSKLAWCKQIEYSVHKFSFTKNNIPELLYSNKMRLRNKIPLHKTVLKSILLYESQVWGSAASFNLQIIETVQNKVLRCISKSSKYERNDTILRDFKIDPFKISIRKLPQNSSRIG